MTPPRESLAEMIARHADADAQWRPEQFASMADWPSVHEIAAQMARDAQIEGTLGCTVVTERGKGYVHAFGVSASWPKLRGAK